MPRIHKQSYTLRWLCLLNDAPLCAARSVNSRKYRLPNPKGVATVRWCRGRVIQKRHLRLDSGRCSHVKGLTWSSSILQATLSRWCSLSLTQTPTWSHHREPFLGHLATRHAPLSAPDCAWFFTERHVGFLAVGSGAATAETFSGSHPGRRS